MKRAHPMSCGVLLLAFAALVFHVCALDVMSQEPSTRMVSATPTDASPHVPHIHGASCEGIKPGMLSSALVVVWTRPVFHASTVGSTARPTVAAAPVPASRSPLYILNASLLI